MEVGSRHRRERFGYIMVRVDVLFRPGSTWWRRLRFSLPVETWAAFMSDLGTWEARSGCSLIQYATHAAGSAGRRRASRTRDGVSGACVDGDDGTASLDSGWRVSRGCGRPRSIDSTPVRDTSTRPRLPHQVDELVDLRPSAPVISKMKLVDGCVDHTCARKMSAMTERLDPVYAGSPRTFTSASSRCDAVGIGWSRPERGAWTPAFLQLSLDLLRGPAACRASRW